LLTRKSSGGHQAKKKKGGRRKKSKPEDNRKACHSTILLVIHVPFIVIMRIIYKYSISRSLYNLIIGVPSFSPDNEPMLRTHLFVET
jgi:hypothetical protein